MVKKLQRLRICLSVSHRFAEITASEIHNLLFKVVHGCFQELARLVFAVFASPAQSTFTFL